MSSAFLKGMLRGQAGSENPPPSGETGRAGQAAPNCIGEGEKEEQERQAVLTWTLTLWFVAFQLWSFCVWTGAVPSSGPGQDCGMG